MPLTVPGVGGGRSEGRGKGPCPSEKMGDRERRVGGTREERGSGPKDVGGVVS